MTVSSTSNRKTFTGDAVTVAFATSPVVFFEEGDLTVYKVVTATGVATLQVITTDYTVTGGDGSTGTVTMVTAPAATETLVIVRELDLVQEVDFVNNEATDAEVAEDALDKLTMMVQQLYARVTRAFALADSDVSGASTEVPTPVADGVIKWNAAGTTLEAVALAGITPDDVEVSAFMETVLDDATAAAARATLDAQQDVFTTRGDLVRAGASGVAERVALGASGTFPTSDGTDVVWGSAGNRACDFRLTLTTGVPVTSTDVTAAETLYFAPYKGNRIDLYDGTRWVRRTSAQMSIDVPDVTGVHDVFCYDNAGTPTLEVLVWTNDTTRATALTTQDGVLVKTGAVTRRYLGTFYSTTAGNGQTEDSVAKRYLWNYYNRCRRPMSVVEGTDSWTYTTATIRQANGAAGNKLEYVCGVAEDAVSARAQCTTRNSTASIQAVVGIGVDSTSTFSGVRGFAANAANTESIAWGRYTGIPGIGLRYLSWNEYSSAVGTQTFVSDNGGTVVQAGITGEVFA